MGKVHFVSCQRIPNWQTISTSIFKPSQFGKPHFKSQTVFPKSEKPNFYKNINFTLQEKSIFYQDKESQIGEPSPHPFSSLPNSGKLILNLRRSFPNRKNQISIKTSISLYGKSPSFIKTKNPKVANCPLIPNSKIGLGKAFEEKFTKLSSTKSDIKKEILTLE